jgi:hypothetical protein
VVDYPTQDSGLVSKKALVSTQVGKEATAGRLLNPSLLLIDITRELQYADQAESGKRSERITLNKSLMYAG